MANSPSEMLAAIDTVLAKAKVDPSARYTINLTFQVLRDGQEKPVATTTHTQDADYQTLAGFQAALAQLGVTITGWGQTIAAAERSQK